MKYDITDTSTGEKLYTALDVSDIILGATKDDDRTTVLLPDGEKLIFEPSGRYMIAAHIDEPESPQVEPTIDELRAAKLAVNSELCGQILENEFKSTIKGDGLQPYRMNDDDQKNILGYQSMILFGLFQDPTGSKLPLFEWKNKNQIKCSQDWTWKQILNLFQEYGAWKVLVLERQDDIKERIINAQTADEVEAVELDYSDLLIFGDG